MRQPSETRRGRPPRYSREQLLRVDSSLRDLLARETRISVRSFVGQYLLILDFPKDIRDALERGEVNLFEELRMISRALREIGPEEVTDEDLSEIMPAVDQITLTLQKIARRKEREAARRLTI